MTAKILLKTTPALPASTYICSSFFISIILHSLSSLTNAQISKRNHVTATVSVRPPFIKFQSSSVQLQWFQDTKNNFCNTGFAKNLYMLYGRHRFLILVCQKLNFSAHNGPEKDSRRQTQTVRKKKRIEKCCYRIIALYYLPLKVNRRCCNCSKRIR